MLETSSHVATPVQLRCSFLHFFARRKTIMPLLFIGFRATCRKTPGVWGISAPTASSPRAALITRPPAVHSGADAAGGKPLLPGTGNTEHRTADTQRGTGRRLALHSLLFTRQIFSSEAGPPERKEPSSRDAHAAREAPAWWIAARQAYRQWP